MRRALVALALTLSACAPPNPRALERQARVLVYEKLSTPEAPVIVGPAVVQGDYAMVDFTRGAFEGGRTLLRRDKDAWVLTLCGGAPLREPKALQGVGVPQAAASALTEKLIREENRLPDRRPQFDKWRTLGGTVDCPEAK
jgi:hypothetical protein